MQKTFCTLATALMIVALTTHPVHAQTCMPLPDGAISWLPMNPNGPADVLGLISGDFTRSGSYASPGFIGSSAELHDPYNYWVGDSSLSSLTNNFTWEFWFRYDSIARPGDPSSAVIAFAKTFSFSEGGVRISMGTQLWPKLTPGFTVDKNVFSEPYSVCISRYYTPLPSQNVWHHLALVVSASGTTVYLDGVSLGTDTAPCATAPIDMTDVGRAAPFYFGAGGREPDGWGWNTIDGGLDEFTAYNRALSASEIAAIYNAGSAGKCMAYAGTVPVIASGDTSSVSSTPNPDGTTTLNIVSASGGNTYSITLPPGTAPATGQSNISITVENPSTTFDLPRVLVDAQLPPGTTKSVQIEVGDANRVCLKDKSNAIFGADVKKLKLCKADGGNLAKLPKPGKCKNVKVNGDLGDNPKKPTDPKGRHKVQLCRSADGQTLTVKNALHTAIEMFADAADDDDFDDDGHVDSVDSDADNDGHPNDEENCKYGDNEEQIDDDGDGVGNMCDDD